MKVEDRRLARIIQRARELPGQELFQYVGDDGAVHAIAPAPAPAKRARAKRAPSQTAMPSHGQRSRG